MPSSIAGDSQKPQTRRIFEIQRGILKIIQLILSDKHLDGAGQSLRYFLDKFKQWHFHSSSNEVIWLKKISNYMQGLKSAILAIFSDRARMAVPCQYGPQESLVGFQKLFLLWVPMNSQQCWKAKLERAYSFRVQW